MFGVIAQRTSICTVKASHLRSFHSSSSLFSFSRKTNGYSLLRDGRNLNHSSFLKGESRTILSSSNSVFNGLQRTRNFRGGDKDKEYTYFKESKNSLPFHQRNRTALIIAGGILAFSGVYYVYHLDTVAISGRRRMMDVSPEEEIKMAEIPYRQVLAQYKSKILPQNSRHVRAVKRVGMRIIKASGLPELERLKWEWTVIDSPEMNAFVLPGGKVCVFTGILPVMKDEDGMATVLAHEIGHVVARHSAEQWSFRRILFLFNAVLNSWLHIGVVVPLLTTTGLLLPFSRACESEADHIGLLLMAKACYDYRKAPELWIRMDKKQEKHGAALERFLSTHPTHARRREDLVKWQQQAAEESMRNNCTLNMHGYMRTFKDFNEQPRVIQIEMTDDQ